MSAKPHTVAIGVFVVGTVALVFFALVYFGGIGLFGSREEREQAVVVFTGSVKGLNVGAPLTLRGVKIGEVRAIDIQPDPKSHEFVIPVSVSVNVGDLGRAPATPGESILQPLIDRGLRAQLKTQSLLTGLLYIDLDFLPGSKPRYVDYQSEVPQIPTAPTELEAILQRVSDLDIGAFMQHADQSLKALSVLLSNIETQNLPANLNATLADVRRLTVDANRQINELGHNVNALASTTNGAVAAMRGDVDALATRIDGTLLKLDATLASVRQASDGVDYTLSEQSPLVFELKRSVAELGRAARALQALADGIEREPEALLRGRSEDKEEGK